MDAGETFVAYLNSLDDEYYFFLANAVLGRIPAPFHKPVLNGKILSFLLNTENRANILASLDREDRKLITFLLISQQATAAETAAFFSEDSFILVATRLSNLRDRLLLLKDGDGYSINPVMTDLLQKAYDGDLVFGKQKPEQTGPFVDRNILFAVANLLINGSSPVREANIHHFLKSGKLTAVFPQFSEVQSRTFFLSLRKLLISRKAVVNTDGRFLLRRDSIRSLLELDPMNLMIHAIDPNLGSAIARCLSVLQGFVMEKHRLSTLLGILSGLDEEKANDILETIEAFGFISIINDSVYYNQSTLEPFQTRSELKADSDLRVSFFGTPDADDILYLFSDVIVCDKLITYAITKDSFFRALELGLETRAICAYLGDENENRFSMWQQAFSRLRLYDGILINCDRDIKAIIERHPELKDHIIRSFSEDLILMKRSTFHIWQKTLAYAMDMQNLPVPSDSALTEEEEEQTEEKGSTFTLPELPESSQSNAINGKLAEELLDYAKKAGCRISEIEPLIRERIIVSKSQIDKSFRYAGRITASGLDYNAKLAAIKSAISKAKDRDSALLELELPSEKLIVQPLEIVKSGPSSNVLRSKVLPDGTERNIPVSSIFQVTVLKWTLR